MDIDSLTLKQIKQLQCLLGDGKVKKQSDLPVEVGECYFIRTVTLYYTGKLKCICGDALVLEKAAWIADTGRFYDFLKNGTANEVEPFVDDVIIPTGSIIDITAWKHALPEKQK